jgi:hypothetical protein
MDRGSGDGASLVFEYRTLRRARLRGVTVATPVAAFGKQERA